jgi:hypothetical protein
MKKTLMSFVMALLVAGTAFAKTELTGSFAPLKELSAVKFSIEFLSIHGMPEADFAVYEQDWNKDKPEVVGLILSYAMNANGSLALLKDAKSDYSLQCVVTNITVKGDYTCNLLLFDANGNEIASIRGIQAKGGKVGSKLNLIKDGAEHTGKKIGKALKAATK